MKTDALDLLVVSLAATLGDGRDAGALRALARQCGRAQAQAARTHQALAHAHPPVLRRGPGWAWLGQGSGPAVACTLRMGAYMLGLLELGRAGRDAELLAGGDFIRRQQEVLQRCVAAMGRRLRILDASAPLALRRAGAALREGCMVAALADSNLGLRGHGASSNTVTVDFLGARVPVRAGTAWLAQQAGAPLLPVATYREDRDWVAEYAEPVFLDRRPEARAAAMQALYAQFERWIRAHPEQWQGWTLPLLYWPPPAAPRVARAELEQACRRCAQVLAAPGALRLRADPVRAAAFELEGEWLALDGRGRRLLRISAGAAELLEAARRNRPLRALARPPQAAELARLQLAGLVELV